MKGMVSKITSYAIGTALVAIVFGALLFGGTKQDPIYDPISSREVVAYEILPGQEVVKYEYVGEPLPEKLAPDEDIEKRTEASYHRLLSIENEGTREETRTYAGVFYTRPTFVEGSDGWHYIEHATTTEAAFNATRKENAFASLFWRKAHADSIAPFSGAGDGAARHLGGTDFSECYLGAGSAVDGTGTTALIQATDNTQIIVEEPVYTCNIRRGFLPFDTSSMPVGSSVSATTLHVYVTTKVNQYNDGVDYIAVVETSQATHTTLATSDFPSVGTTQGATAIDIGSITTSAYNVFTFNSTGRSNFVNAATVDAPCSATNGITCIGLREGHDLNNLGLAQDGSANSITISTSEATGTSQDPYLTVTYSAGANFAFWQFQDF